MFFRVATNSIITDEQVAERARVAVEIAIMKHKALEVPIVGYDRKTKRVYLEYNDGRRVEVNWVVVSFAKSGLFRKDINVFYKKG